jgi:tRNA-specific 2-thiouridylase
MSGGVDSAVAALLLRRAGLDVVGVTLHLADLTENGLGVSRCCSPTDVALAREAAETLGIPHFVIDARDGFKEAVLEPFVEDYLRGVTPSPCVRCNSRVKFGELLEIGRQMEAEILASGHYARRVVGTDGRSALLRASDRGKDQSYFLFELRPEQLEVVRFPLGDLGKAEVRELARRAGLRNADRADSQEVCFVPEGRTYTEVLERLAGGRLPGAGPIEDAHGNLLGTHGGHHLFTVGQRRGLGLAGTQRMYVTGIDASRNAVTVGTGAQASRKELVIENVNWLVERPEAGLRADVQVRSRHAAQGAVVEAHADGRARVVFDEPVDSPAPGQAAVFYEGERVVGGGWIAACR